MCIDWLKTVPAIVLIELSCAHARVWKEDGSRRRDGINKTQCANGDAFYTVANVNLNVVWRGETGVKAAVICKQL